MSGLLPFRPSVYIALSASHIKKEEPVYRTDTETPLEKIELLFLNWITERIAGDVMCRCDGSRCNKQECRSNRAPHHTDG
jgi:hypothetical protein